MEEDKKRAGTWVEKVLLLGVMFGLVAGAADIIHPGSSRLAGALIGFAIFAGFFGGILSMFLNRVLLMQAIGPRRGLLTSCIITWVLLLIFLLARRPDGDVLHSLSIRFLGVTIGMIVAYWLQRRWQGRAVARP